MNHSTGLDADGTSESTQQVRYLSAVPAVLWSLSGVSFLILAFVIWISRFLRPIADDYSIGVSARDGLVVGLWGWWQGWSGDLTTMFANTLLVGMPLVWLPWSAASALPFVLAALTVVGLATWLIMRCPNFSLARGQQRLQVLRVVPVAVLAWWGYWWVSVLLSPEGPNNYALAQGVTFWQNLNAAYIVTSALLIWGWLYLESRKTSPRLWLLYLVIGLLAGFNGPVFASSALLMIALIAASSWLRTGAALRVRGISWLIASLGIIVGAVASQVSPGSQSRKTLLNNPEINAQLVFRVATEGIPGGVNDWLSAVTSPGAWTVVVLLAGMTTLLARQGWTPNVDFLLTVGTSLLTFSLLLSLANRASEFFAYPAYWHLVQPRSVVWLGLVMVAATLGAHLGRRGGRSLAVPVAALAAVSALALTATSIALMTSEMYARGQQWELGPAPLTHVSDIESPEGWQRAAWLELQRLRESAPPRGLA